MPLFFSAAGVYLISPLTVCVVPPIRPEPLLRVGVLAQVRWDRGFWWSLVGGTGVVSVVFFLRGTGVYLSPDFPRTPGATRQGTFTVVRTTFRSRRPGLRVGSVAVVRPGEDGRESVGDG